MGTPKRGRGRSARREGLSCEGRGARANRRGRREPPGQEEAARGRTGRADETSLPTEGDLAVHGPARGGRRNLPRLRDEPRHLRSCQRKKVVAAARLPTVDRTASWDAAGARGAHALSRTTRGSHIEHCSVPPQLSSPRARRPPRSASSRRRAPPPTTPADGPAPRRRSSTTPSWPRSGWPSGAGTSGTRTVSSARSTRSRRAPTRWSPRDLSPRSPASTSPRRRTFAFTSNNDDHSVHHADDPQQGQARRRRRPQRLREVGEPGRAGDVRRHLRRESCASGGARCLLHEDLPDPRRRIRGRSTPTRMPSPTSGDGAWAVADAGGNDILRVDRRGQVSTIAVLPRQPVTLTAEQVAGMGAPACLAGATYAFEPVPTDVERGEHGKLWVSTLPGGPEDPSLGARGSVYTVNPWKHSTQRVATGFLGATDLALGRRRRGLRRRALRRQGHQAEARQDLDRRRDRPTALDRDAGRLALRRHARGHHVRPSRAGGQRARQHHPLPPLTGPPATMRGRVSTRPRIVPWRDQHRDPRTIAAATRCRSGPYSGRIGRTAAHRVAAASQFARCSEGPSSCVACPSSP